MRRFGLSGGAGAGRHDPRPAGRDAVPQGAGDQPGRSDVFLNQPISATLLAITARVLSRALDLASPAARAQRLRRARWYRSPRWRRARGRGYRLLLHTPIPWMLGPLSRSRSCASPASTSPCRPPIAIAASGSIGTSLGLYFTPIVACQVIELWWLLLAGALFAIALGYISGVALAARGIRQDRPRALCERPGGASEMWSSASASAACRSHRRRAKPAHPDRRRIVPAAITARRSRRRPLRAGATGFDARGFALLMALHVRGQPRLSAALGCPTRSCWARSRWRSR